MKLLKKHKKKNGVEVIVLNGKRWMNETKIKDQLKHSNLVAATLQYSGELRKQRQELKDCGNHQPCSRFLEEEFALQIIMDCRTIQGFNQYYPNITQEQSILSKIVRLFAAEKIILQRNVLDCRIDEVDEQGHNDRDIDYEIERQKATENKFGCEFIRINPAQKRF